MVFELKSERKKVPGKAQERQGRAKISTPLSYNACFSEVPASKFSEMLKNLQFLIVFDGTYKPV